MKELVKLRTKYFDDTLDAKIAAGCRQVVVLGAGLDTRSVRKAAAAVTYFEIDDAGTIDLKRACLARHGMLGDTRFIAGNYVNDGMMRLLLNAGFDPELPTYVIWEGNTMYLPLSCDKAILTELKSNVDHFQVSFDHFAKSIIAKTTSVRGLTRMAENFEAMNAPGSRASTTLRRSPMRWGCASSETSPRALCTRAIGRGHPHRYSGPTIHLHARIFAGLT
jgi:methyltransferase (TIGR00027 family)